MTILGIWGVAAVKVSEQLHASMRNGRTVQTTDLKDIDFDEFLPCGKGSNTLNVNLCLTYVCEIVKN